MPCFLVFSQGMNLSKKLALLLLLSLPFAAFAQRNRDMLVFKDGNTQTGKIIRCDSVSLVLRKVDHSTTKYEWSQIDSVRGLPYRTYFFSASLGISKVNYWSTLLYRDVKSTSQAFYYRYGNMSWRRWAKYIELEFIGARPFKMQRLGGGVNYYMFTDYTKPWNAYLGLDASINMVDNNKNFVSTGLHFGTEYLYKNKYRLFAEMDFQKAIFNINKNSSFCFLVGMKWCKELEKYYKKLNQTRKLR